MLVGWFQRAESKEGGLQEKELGWCFDGRTWWWLAQAISSNIQSFDRTFILNLIFEIQSLQTVRTFFKIHSRNFSRKKLVLALFLLVGSYCSRKVWSPMIPKGVRVSNKQSYATNGFGW